MDGAANDRAEYVSSDDKEPVSVLIVDDELFVRRVLRVYMGSSERIQVVGEAASGAEALQLLGRVSVDVVLMDLQMPQMDGIHCTRQIVAEHPETRVLVVTGHITDTYLTSALVAGASGYIVKDAEPEAMVSAVLEVASGGCPIDSHVAHLLVERIRSSDAPDSSQAEFPPLTDREHEVLERLCSGENTKEISSSLFISEATVKHHLANLMRKFQVRDRVQLVIYALKNHCIG